jgi:hypothetical protein
MLVIAVLMQTVWLSVPAAEVSAIVLFELTVIIPLAVIVPQPPVSVAVYENGLPTVVVGVPLIVTTFPAQAPVTPVGRPLNVAPVAPVVEYVILVIAVLMHTV